MFGKFASSITDYLISSDSFDPEHCSSLLQKSLKKKADTVAESIQGYQMTREQKERIIMVRSHLEFIQQSIAKLDDKLDKMVVPYESAITLLCTIPGVDRDSAITIISEIGTDKPALVQVAHAAVKSNRSPYYRIKYERICKRRGKKRAIIAIARMILTAVYHMFVTGEVFNPSDLYKIDMPQEMLEKQKEKAIKQAAKLLISHGLIKAADISVA